MPTPFENLTTRLLEPALQRGWTERIALREADSSLTYGQLANRVKRLASVLQALGIERGERVAVLMRDSIDAAVAILGIMHMGGVAVPLSELSRPVDVRDYLIHSGATAVITHTSLEPTVDQIRVEAPLVREVLCVGACDRAGVHDFEQLIADAIPAATAAAVSPGETAMILYAAVGAEQKLRAIPHAHATPMSAFGSFARGMIGLDMDDRVFSVVRLSTTYGLGTGLYFALAAGAETYLLPEQPHSEAIFSVIATFDPTVFVATPSIYGQLARDVDASEIDRPLSSCRVCLSGAEGMPPKLVPRIREALGAEVTVGYGLTEAFQFVFAGIAGNGPLGNVGRPVPGFEARIIDDEGTPLGPDVIGTLQIRGPTVLSSYWGANQPDEQRFHDGWFTTRDRFMMDEYGNFFHCGRMDDLFKVGGKWVSPQEVERVLLSHEEVWDCAVIGADDEDGLIKPLAFIVPNIGHEPGQELENKLREYVKNELSPYKYPRWIEFCDKLPKGPGGKLLRYKLRAPEQRREVEASPDEE